MFSNSLVEASISTWLKNFSEGRRKKEEGRRKKEEGRRKKEEGRRKP
ncbi:hypothetical protein QUB70_20305 [Microcoleus sp. A003_D6]